jgi:recombination endonuclease VII
MSTRDSVFDKLPIEDQCGKWMTRKKTTCARRPGHRGECRTAQALIDSRQPKTARRRGTRLSADPAARRRWNLAYRWSRYGITSQQFDRLLELQRYACAMCDEPFRENTLICVDHDHECCPGERRSCGKCVRGLLCLSCNAALGHIERKYQLARRYLENPPGPAVLGPLPTT